MTGKDRKRRTTGNVGGLTPQRVNSSTVSQVVFDLFDDDQVVVMELDADCRIVRCNIGVAAGTGYTVEELTNRFPPDLLGELPISTGRHSHPRPAASASYVCTEKEQWRCKDGGCCTIHWHKLWSYRDRPGYLKLGSYVRQSEDTFADDAAGRDQLDAYLQAAPDSIITISDRGRMVSVNPATERLFGYRRSALLGRNVSMLMPKPEGDRHDTYIGHYLETGEARVIGIGRTITARRKDGSTFPARLSVCEFESHGRRFFTGMLHDITERLEAEEQKRAMFAEHAHASRVVALGEMASSIAHEINQPLAAIVSFADASRKFIEAGAGDMETLDHALQQISEQGQRAGEIIRRLRQFVKKKEPDHSTVDVNELIQAAAELTLHDAERYGISLKFELHPEPLTALVDRLQIEQLVLNLIRNSLEAINETGETDGTITIRSRANGGSVEVAVSDNGPGIKLSEPPRVFDPFYTTKKKGTGLGLSISRSIAEAHGGTLSFEPNKHRGVTFLLTLPTDTGSGAP
jgi:two-component system sensor kinase FixL